MRISDWSSDVCSSDLRLRPVRDHQHLVRLRREQLGVAHGKNRRGIQNDEFVALAQFLEKRTEARGGQSRARVLGGAFDADHRQLRYARIPAEDFVDRAIRSEEHTSELQSLMRISYAVFCLKKKKDNIQHHTRLAKKDKIE